MHLLLAQKGTLADGDEAIDLGQTPADMVFISAADTELAALARARKQMGDEAPELRLANLLQLSHPLSIDTYAQKTIAGSKLVVVRCLGGESYWPYGLEKLYQIAFQHNIPMAVLPGDDKPDPSLVGFNTVGEQDQIALWQFLLAGGENNARAFLAYGAFLLGRGEKPPRAAPFLKAGPWWPGIVSPTLCDIRDRWLDGAPVVAITFYRALVQSGNLAPIEALVESLRAAGLNPLPVYISSLKEPVSCATVETLFDETSPMVVLNTTGFAVSTPGGKRFATVLEKSGSVVLQVVLSSSDFDTWQTSPQGLSARDLAMNVALPEVDGRLLSRAIAFKSAAIFDDACQTSVVTHQPAADRVDFVAKLAANWTRLRLCSAAKRRIALVLANYPNRDGRLGNGVGLDTPAGTIEVLRALQQHGYNTGEFPADGDSLIRHLQRGPTNATLDDREIRETLKLDDYLAFFAALPNEVQQQVYQRWGAPQDDPFFHQGRGAFALPLTRFGNVVIGIQPARGYNIDPKETYHSPDLVPPHGYFAFYCWLRRQFDAHAIAHMGKHGNLEWLPGKALALRADCFPEAVFGPTPHLYPFIVNDPGEGTQAKRRAQAVIIDHLTPPLTRAEAYGPMKQLEALVDEYYEASGVDPRRLVHLKKLIFELIQDSGLDLDAGIGAGDGDTRALEKLDAYLCELKEMQIRDGLHIFGVSPEGRLKTDLAVALARLPRGKGEGEDQSLHRAIAADLRFDGFDPLDCDMAKTWQYDRPAVLTEICDDPWRSYGDTVERIEILASLLVDGERACEETWHHTKAALVGIKQHILPSIERCGEAEINGFLTGLEGRFVAPGPSGAPTRGRVDVLPTGRNFYSVDSRTLPTPAAWALGQKSAELLLVRHRQEQGEWPKRLGLSAWGTSNMRTGGDDIAQMMALTGVKPVWEHGSGRLTGYEILPLAILGRPRIDVTLRISGFFRDAFPLQIDLLDQAVRAVMELDEDAEDNPLAARYREEKAALQSEGFDREHAAQKAGYRIFGSKPGAYGAGLQALIDERGWEDRNDLAKAYLAWGGYAYGANAEGEREIEQYINKLKDIEAVVHNQDNREHDILDSDDYYQFEGGMTAAVEHLSGQRPAIYHNDHSRPERPVIRTLEEEIGRVVRARVANPKWISGAMRHGYKGAFEMAATVDYLFAFAATTGAVRDHHFEAIYQAFLGDEKVSEFLQDKNPSALKEMAERLLEAQDRKLWTARSNSARFELEKIAAETAG